MSKMNKQLSYILLDEELARQQIGMTAAEIHGLISGMLCAGNQDSSWQTLLHELTNDGMVFSGSLSQHIRQLYAETAKQLDEGNFMFQLFLPDDNTGVFNRANAFAGWVNHFLLGLGVIQTRLDKLDGDIREVVDDLRNIAQLGCDEDDNPEELAQDLEEVIEYVRVAGMLCYNTFTQEVVLPPETTHNHTLH